MAALPLRHLAHAGGESPATERETELWEAYQRVNERFADVVGQLARESDLVWVHDYHLMLLPSMLRQRQPRIKVGFFLHTPWPSSEVFRTLPMRREVLQGILGADLIGFHVYDYARHFLHGCTRLLGSEVSFSSRKLRWGGRSRRRRRRRVGALGARGRLPDRHRPAALPRRPRVARRQGARRRAARAVPRLLALLGVDRVDYIKGIPQKLLAMEALLTAHPELVGRVVLLQIAVPTRTEVPEYQRLRAAAHRLVGRINGRFGSPTYNPIQYLDQSAGFEELVALYHVADACVVTSLRDGMNLVSYEYVACQEGGGDPGVLVLSEFAGAAQTLGAGCVRVNPYNIDELARGIYEAISMPAEQRRELHAYASQYIAKYTSQAWAQAFIASLAEQSVDDLSRQASHAVPLPADEVVAAYANASRRLLVIGVGGTFLPATGATANDEASLTEEQESLLMRLLQDPANTVLLTSGRSRHRMDELMASFASRLTGDGRVYVSDGDGDGDHGGSGGAAWRRQ